MRHSIAAVAWVGLALAAFASPQARSEEVRDRVCVYEHADYGGYEQCFAAGTNINDLGRLHDRISSVRILGRGEITLYEHTNFQGREISITSDVADLRRFGFWNDAADSLRVGYGGGYRDRDRRDERRDYDRRGYDRRDERRDYDRGGGRDSSFGEDRVCFYEHTNFRGRSECWDLGDDVSDLRARRMNDEISSVRVFGRTRIVVFEDINYGGQRLSVEGDIADLTQVYVDGRGSWNDRISSFRIGGGSRRDGR